MLAPELLWTFDTTLAEFISTGLTGLMAEADKSCTEQVEGITQARDTFAAYAADNFPFSVGNERAAEFDDALVWLALNFRNLWD